MLKRLLRSPFVMRAAASLIGAYIGFVYATSRWTIEGQSHVEEALKSGRGVILAFWHGRLLMMPKCWRRNVPIEMLISEHRDGRIIANTVAHFGIDTVTGSSTRGGSGALRRMVSVLKDGGYVGITPDGPRGPRMRASEGIVAVAKLSGVPVIPATYSVARRKVLGSWDRFLIAWPFNRGVIVWGNPIEVDRKADAAALDAARVAIESELNRISDEADRLVGQSTIEPAPLAPAEATP